MPSAFVSLVLVVLCAAAYMHFTQPRSVQSIIDDKVREAGGPQAVRALDLVSAAASGRPGNHNMIYLKQVNRDDNAALH